MMDSIFGDLIEGCIVIIYMNDIFLFTKTLEQLEINTKKVLQRLQENDLFLKPKKCEFGKEKVEWLGKLAWLSKKEKYPWTLVNSKESQNGQNLPQLSKHEDS